MVRRCISHTSEKSLRAGWQTLLWSCLANIRLSTIRVISMSYARLPPQPIRHGLLSGVGYADWVSWESSFLNLTEVICVRLTKCCHTSLWPLEPFAEFQWGPEVTKLWLRYGYATLFASTSQCNPLSFEQELHCSVTDVQDLRTVMQLAKTARDRLHRARWPFHFSQQDWLNFIIKKLTRHEIIIIEKTRDRF